MLPTEPVGSIHAKGGIVPTLEVLKVFVLTRIIPPLVGIAATWIIGTHVLALFQFTHDQIANEITELVTWAVSTGLAWLGAHFALKGHYIPGKTGTDTRG